MFSTRNKSSIEQGIRPFRRRLRFHLLLVRRMLRRQVVRLTLFSGWTWVAAGSLIGFEMLDIVFGAFLLAPEFLPLVILGLALAWFFREKLRALLHDLRVRARARRAFRRSS